MAHAQLPAVDLGRIGAEFERIATGLSSPVEMIPANDGTGRLFVVEQPGRIRILNNGAVSTTPFLDMTALTQVGGEQGLLGLAFHPGFSNPASAGFRKLYTFSTQPPTGTPDFTVAMSGSPANHCVITEWQVSATNADAVDPATRRDVLRIAHPQTNHNGGKIAFRPSDGYLYIALGDGGGANDVGDGHTPNIGNAQDTTRVLGKILRIDPLTPSLTPASTDLLSANGRYRIPRTNPYVANPSVPENAREIFALGFRNPYRFSFDPATDRLIVGDVGQNTIEEIDVVNAGRNYGWNRKEGSFLFNPATGTVSNDLAPNPAYTNPVLEYDHEDGTSVIGGFVYRGSAVPSLVGKYVFADLSQPGAGGGRVMIGDLETHTLQGLRIGIDARRLGYNVKGIGSDAAGEIYLLVDNSTNTAGQILKMITLPFAESSLNSLSTRALVQTADGVTIAGIVITGSAPKTVIVRAIGPSLAVNGQPVPGRLMNPALALYDGSGKQIDFNDDWMTHPRQQEVRNANLTPNDPREAAITATLSPGDYTAVMSGTGGSTGIGLVALHDVDPTAPTTAFGLSGRASVQTGDNVVIGGVIVAGNAPQRAIFRGLGPTLATFGVTGVLQNPTLDVVDASGTIIASNDNWRSDQAQEIIASGFAPPSDAEAAVIRNLVPGNYTAILRGAGNTTGIGLVDIYRLPQQ